MSKLERYRWVKDRPPNRLDRVVDFVRSYWSGPLTANSPEIARLFGDSRPVSSGVPVNEHTALNYSAVWAAVNLIASDIAALPLVLLRRNDTGGKDRFTNHPLYRLLHDSPNPEMTSSVWRRTMQAHVLTWGNGYSEIVRDQAGRPMELWPLTPDRITPVRNRAGDLLYRVANPSGGEEFFDAADILHVHGLGYDGTCGYSVIHRAREAVGLGLATERFGGSFFGNGATFGGVVSFPGDATELAKKNFRETMAARHQGVDRAHKLLALYAGATYKETGVPPDDAQFLETRKFQVTEIARWFNVPPHKLGDLERSTHSNIEQQNIDYYISAMLPWLRVWEQELMLKLVAPSERNIQIIEHIVEGMLRGDSISRGEFHSKQFSIASITPNEVREIEGRNKITGGDRAFVAMNLIPLDRVDDWIDAQIDAKKPAPTPQNVPQPPGNPDKQRELELALEERDRARAKAQEYEDAKDRLTHELSVRTVELTQEQAAHATTIVAKDADLARVTAQATSLETDLAAAAADVARAMNAVIEADYQRVCREKDALETRAVAAETLAAERLILIEGLGLDVTVAQTGRIEAEKREAALLARANAAETLAEEQRAQIGLLNQGADKLVQEALAATAGRVAAEAKCIELEAARQVAVDASTRAAGDLAQAEKDLAAAGVAVRDVLLDGLGWLIEREAERARRHQGSPEKLRKWLDSFYRGYDELCRKILRPSVRAWALCAGRQGSVDHVLDAFVTEHIESSIRQLSALADEQNVDTLAPALERVLRRWETERAVAAADRLCREAA